MGAVQSALVEALSRTSTYAELVNMLTAQGCTSQRANDQKRRIHVLQNARQHALTGHLEGFRLTRAGVVNGSHDLSVADRVPSRTLGQKARSETTLRTDERRIPRRNSVVRSLPIVGEGAPTRAFVVDSKPGADFTPGAIQTTGRDPRNSRAGQGRIAVQGRMAERHTRVRAACRLFRQRSSATRPRVTSDIGRRRSHIWSPATR